MFHVAFKLKNGVSRSLLPTSLFVLMLCGFGFTFTPAAEPAFLETGFRQMYNMDFAGAHHTFQSWQQLHPDDPLGAAANAAAYLFSEFDRLHILEFRLFTDDEAQKKLRKIVPDPHIKAAFDGELAKADQIAAQVLAESPNNKNALFAQVLAAGLRGDYAGLIEKRSGAALDYLKASRTTAEKLIDIDPAYYDAYLAIGIENYMAGLRSAPVRWLLRMSGAQTDKDQGIANLKITAEKGRYLAPYAQILLAIAAVREDESTTAIKLLSGLIREFPQNHLYRKELARLH
jgi:hypothetical protein